MLLSDSLDAQPLGQGHRKSFYKYCLNESKQLRSEHSMENFNVNDTAVNGKHGPLVHTLHPAEDQEHPAKRPFWMVAKDILAKFKPPAFGLPSLDRYIYGWKRGANIVVSGRLGMAASDLTLTLAEHFASHAGPVIWIGVNNDHRSITERLLLREACIERYDSSTVIFLDDAGRLALTAASDKLDTLRLEFCDIDDCGDEHMEQEFLTRVTSDLPTLIVVEPSAFGDSSLDPFEVLVRRKNVFRMVGELKQSNRDWRVLWQLPVAGDSADSCPTILDLDEPTVTDAADVIMFAHRQPEQSALDAELVIVKNDFGSTTATIPMQYDAAFSSWREVNHVEKM
jgi:hypothetical protein